MLEFIFRRASLLRWLPAVLLAAACASPSAASAKAGPATVERWGTFEIELTGPKDGNPFVDVSLDATFSQGDRNLTVLGFYDGGGKYRVRFMPDAIGTWTYRTRSNHKSLDGRTGKLSVTAPSPGNHGPVRVAGKHHFAYDDGKAYLPVGTTAYAWIHQPAALQDQTLKTLAAAPFNKIRMCVFPKWYEYNRDEPAIYPFERDAAGQFDFSRPNLNFFRHLDGRVRDLMKLGIEADLIIFHPYDEGHWGFDRMPPDADDRYLRYLIARVGAYRNVWWSLANEYDLLKKKTPADWDRYLDIVAKQDPFRHPTSIHNGEPDRIYDPRRAPITHLSVQHPNTGLIASWRTQFDKPVVDDECEYEGNFEVPWGNISAEELVHRFWVGFMGGGYVGHAETYAHPKDEIWWSRGGALHGQSPARIAFLRRVIEEHGPIEPLTNSWMWTRMPAARHGETFLVYYGPRQPMRLTWMTLSQFPLSKDGNKPHPRWRFQLIDTWNMTVTDLPGVHEGKISFDLPAKPYLALRAIPVR